MSDIKNLEPKLLWNYFHEITQIPRPSKKEHRMTEYLEKFGLDHGFETIVDKTGNVIIRKPATKGMENRKGIILQGHVDMVPQKNSDKKFDFEKDPIETRVDQGWVKANGTTLGADNGMGVAAAMAVLTDPKIVHGPIEALFTVDEETGMTGAKNLEKGVLKGEILINMDSEDEGELYVGCAGGVDVSALRTYKQEKTPAGMTAYSLTLKGLKGGHSGLDIHLGKANATKLMFRFFQQAEHDFGMRITDYSGGNLRNAIPREAFATVVAPTIRKDEFEKFIKGYEKMYRSEFNDVDPDIRLTAKVCETPEMVMNEGDQYRIIRGVFVCPNGVQRMSPSMPGVVETSNNLSVVNIGNGKFEAYSLTRSSVETAKVATAWKIAAGFQLAGAEVTLSGDYPGWNPDMKSAILVTMKDTYQKLYGKIPEIKAIHAGLECGIIMGPYPKLDSISFGPTIRYPHSPDEKVEIASVEKFWNFLVATLKNAPMNK
ncbi:MAG: aminoacyl-histidine dipeptidase [Bacteroidales bacterium]|jgi:dipeptidase D|nr:aminoacyl-histidine dipeptidase [Bacteroidales bacterium]